MKNFIPKLFIGIGATSAFYTLRETYLKEIVDSFNALNGCAKVHHEVWSFHHFNLSQDLDEAIAKAREASEKFGLPFEINREDLEAEMRSIKRATAEEMAERERKEKERQEHYLAAIEEKRKERMLAIDNGIMSFGKYDKEKFEDLPGGYLDWIVQQHEQFEENSLLKYVAEVVLAKFKHLLLPKCDSNLTVGEAGERLTLDVTVLRVIELSARDFVTGRPCSFYITTMRADSDDPEIDGACIVVKSGSFRVDVKDKLKIKGTVKGWGNYKGQNQTQLNRVAIIEEKVAA